ncbi:MAG: HD domain-containing protein [Anaeroplasmataceae bacterium]|nr:HD domain-containing protein [Anaeroplasmataceae bacterium]
MKLNYDDMFCYVLAELNKNKGLKSTKPQLAFRNRFEHIKRVFGWAKRILPEVINCDEEVVLTAAIFHDSGYSKDSIIDHAIKGKAIFLNYAKKNQLNQEFANKVAYIIEHHSNKDLIKDPNIPIELVVLLEADLMDEEGALGIVFDLLAEGYKTPDSYDSVFNEIMIHSAHILEQDYMVTPLAKKFWEKKKKFIQEFIQDLKNDLFME